MALIRTFTFCSDISFGLLLYCSISVSTASARTWHVQSDGTGEAPFIQAAIESSGNGDEILVGPGTYFENIDFLGKAIILHSEMGSAATILDGGGHDSSTVVIRRQEGPETVLDGFTITAGKGSGMQFGRGGGGLWCAGSPVIRNARFQYNGSTFGGGILVNEGAPRIENCILDHNSAENGGAIDIEGSSSRAVIRNNVFSSNGASDGGGVINIALDSGEILIEGNEFRENGFGTAAPAVEASSVYPNTGYPVLILNRNLFVHNYSCGGTTILVYHVAALVVQNTFVDGACTSSLNCHPDCRGSVLASIEVESSSRVEDNIVVGGNGPGIDCYQGSPTFGLNLFWDNLVFKPGSECQISYADALVANPLFCDAAGGDFHVAANSPAIVDGVVLGYYPTPGCPAVPVIPLTWGRLKSLYH